MRRVAVVWLSELAGPGIGEDDLRRLLAESESTPELTLGKAEVVFHPYADDEPLEYQQELQRAKRREALQAVVEREEREELRASWDDEVASILDRIAANERNRCSWRNARSTLAASRPNVRRRRVAARGSPARKQADDPHDRAVVAGGSR